MAKMCIYTYRHPRGNINTTTRRKCGEGQVYNSSTRENLDGRPRLLRYCRILVEPRNQSALVNDLKETHSSNEVLFTFKGTF
ncbi:hypothetical protein TOT_010000502 [Theileria orientalis strain Shintoku]|uniref:Uncharacterized protein n=1 Tax=Theileria orientalis strain Shintoku TaxID=869250 RepID=J4DNI9_THEOR|nr:hypothetical protein TOT_010000502 [Theileria orientalis strain Shintoku]PVC50441.1 hypothetical protein MACL_00002273 [Theileria orientalis]BAM39039.1 hypothetical protein TOT_010000502 [Theileria orientalis strain Shintoku]|eukprot:XP_009689340.1 hypothetical protein TOT_010000502 [Theileria orientalis strain Shintoku]